MSDSEDSRPRRPKKDFTNSTPGTASLCDQLDRVCMLVLMDHRIIIGLLRSYDQFGTIFLDQCVERHVVGTSYCDVKVGYFVVRGESIAILGEMPDSCETPDMTRVTYNEYLELKKEQGQAEQPSFETDWC